MPVGISGKSEVSHMWKVTGPLQFICQVLFVLFFLLASLYSACEKIYYFQVEFLDDQKCLTKTLIDFMRQKNEMEVNYCDDLHISLSKTFPIKIYHIEELWKSINETFSDMPLYV